MILEIIFSQIARIHTPLLYDLRRFILRPTLTANAFESLTLAIWTVHSITDSPLGPEH